MVYGVEGLSEVNCQGSCSGGGLPLVEPDSGRCRQRKQSGGGRVSRSEAMLSVVKEESCSEERQDQAF